MCVVLWRWIDTAHNPLQQRCHVMNERPTHIHTQVRLVKERCRDPNPIRLSAKDSGELLL